MSDVPARIRVFFALWPDERSLAAVRKVAQQVAHERGGRASRDENIHVTVAFIGEISSVRLFALREAGRDAARASRAFELTLDRVGGAAHGIAWLAPNAVPAELHGLHDALIERLDQAGFPTERRAFRPHVTLARNCPRLGRRAERPPVSWPVRRLALVASTLGPGGARYAELDAWPLGDSVE